MSGRPRSSKGGSTADRPCDLEAKPRPERGFSFPAKKRPAAIAQGGHATGCPAPAPDRGPGRDHFHPTGLRLVLNFLMAQRTATITHAAWRRYPTVSPTMYAMYWPITPSSHKRPSEKTPATITQGGQTALWRDSRSCLCAPGQGAPIITAAGAETLGPGCLTSPGSASAPRPRHTVRIRRGQICRCFRTKTVRSAACAASIGVLRTGT